MSKQNRNPQTATAEAKPEEGISAAEAAEQLGFRLSEFAQAMEKWLDELYGEPVADEDDQFVTSSEAARLFGVYPWTVSRWIADGLLAAYARPSGIVLIRRSEVNRYLRRQEISKQGA